jgi:hypothetical protein
MHAIAGKLGVSTTVVALLGALLVVQLALQIYSLVDLARRPAVAGGRKWVWALVIAFVSGFVGSILYLAVGRQAAPALEPAPPDERAARRSTEQVADLLYGPRDEP